MKLCFSTLGCPDWTIKDVAEKGAAYGFDAVELRISGDRHVDPALSQPERQQVKQLFADCGLKIPIISGYSKFSSDDEAATASNVEMIVTNARLASDLGVPYLRTFIGDPGITPRGIDGLREASDKAHELGVTVLAEIHDSLKTGEQAAALIADVNSPGLAILWDIHHSLTAKEPIEDTWKHVGNYIRHLHVKDAGSDNKVCLMGDGVLPVGDIVRLALKNGFDGFFSFEWEKTWIPELEPPEVALPKFVRYMKGLVM